jgi:hypothetical protein
VLDVVQVQLDPLAPRQRRPAVDLRPARDPRPDRQPPALALGRGPISDISPRSTFNRFGSSSSDIRRSSAPTRVIRESFSFTAKPAPMCSAPSTIVRNFSMSNGSPPRPMRRWR